MRKKELEEVVKNHITNCNLTEWSLENRLRGCICDISKLKSENECLRIQLNDLKRTMIAKCDRLGERVEAIESQVPRGVTCPNCQSEDTEVVNEYHQGLSDYACKTCGVYFRGVS